MRIVLRQGEHIALPLGLLCIEWVQDNSLVGKYYDGCWLQGAEHDEVKFIHARLHDGDDVKCLLARLYDKACVVRGEFTLTYNLVMNTPTRQGNLPPPFNLDEL